ncbi:hypothetical protein VNI00_006193 [Paramarasmius palmivorus]|uniref:Glucose-methanol-choline oxidoreductase N-terminal domain-containing protein n=1 Tax=Paramarasmius palmivorus TaxID=297713 RepID=A0AAW0D7R6_9AGAR
MDDWERLGNEGWNWKNYQKYLSRAVSYIPLENTIGRDEEATKIRDIDVHSGTGPLRVTHPRKILDVDTKVYETFLNMGIPKAAAPYHGDPKGLYLSLNTVDPKQHSRTYAAKAYFDPISTRPNLLVLTTAYVHKVRTKGEADGEIRATGVEFSYDGDTKVHIAHANREVIISAGTLKSPQILELSGIGRPNILSKIGVPVKVALDGVGENVQEHQYAGLSFELKDNATETLDILYDPAEAAKHGQLYAEGEGLYMTGLSTIVYMSLHDCTSKADSMHKAQETRVKEGIANNKYPPGLSGQYNIQLERIRLKRPGPELIVFPGFFSHPKTPIPGRRGTIHATSNDPLSDPEIDPRYFEQDIDRQTFIELVHYIRQVARTAPLKDLIGELSPGAHASWVASEPYLVLKFESASPETAELNPGPEFATDEQIAGKKSSISAKSCIEVVVAWLPQGSGTINRMRTFSPMGLDVTLTVPTDTAGSLAMMPREKNGVVDSRLKVYGTKNIRVVDLSIVPLHFTSHSQATVYAIAEQAADILKGVFVP